MDTIQHGEHRILIVSDTKSAELALDNLMRTLNDLHQNIQKGIAKPGDYYFLFQQSPEQKSLIKISTYSTPYHIWFYDYLGRPANSEVAKRLSESFKFHDLFKEELLAKMVEATMNGSPPPPLPDEPLEHGMALLALKGPTRNNHSFFKDRKNQTVLDSATESPLTPHQKKSSPVKS
jgi:hypothetical protein